MSLPGGAAVRTLVLLIGAPGAGKTAACTQLVDQAEQRGWTCAGILSPAHFSGGLKSGIDVLELRTGARRRLAETTAPVRGPAAGRYRFHAAALAWGAQRLAEIASCDLLIVDEIGPLELERGEGWTNAIGILRAGHYSLAVATIRPALVPSLKRALEGLPSGTTLLEVTVLPGQDVASGLLALV